MDLAKGIRAFISGREMILSLTVDTFIMVLNSPRDESRRTYQGCAAVFVIFRRLALRTQRRPAAIRTWIRLSITRPWRTPCYALLKCQRDQSHFLANCISFALNAARLMVLLDCVTGETTELRPEFTVCFFTSISSVPVLVTDLEAKVSTITQTLLVIIGVQTPDESELSWKIGMFSWTHAGLCDTEHLLITYYSFFNSLHTFSKLYT